MEVGIILGQDAYEIQRSLDYRIGTRSEPFVVLTEQEKSNCLSFASTEDVKVAENIQSWWQKRSLCFQNKCCKPTKERAASSEVSREHNKVYRRAVRCGQALE